MENLSRKLKKTFKHLSFKGTTEKIGYHTLMLIGENGKIKHIRILKGLMIALILAQVVLFCAAAFVFYTSRKYTADNKILMNALDISQKNYLAMRDEKDVLTARLVLAESMGKGVGAGAHTSASSVGASEKPFALQTEPATRNSVKVSIDNFKVFHQSKINALTIRFDLKNSGADIQSVTGYIFVILKENNNDQNNWLSVPDVPLISKKPSVINKGHRFSMSGSRQIYLATNIDSTPQLYKVATVFIFSVSGDILMEKDFPVKIQKGGI